MVEKKEHYSFSKLNSFKGCKYAFDLTYNQHKKGIENAFGLYGTFIHSLMEQYAKDELTLFDLPSAYTRGFAQAVSEPFPDSRFCNMAQIYYDQGLSYCKNFAGYDDVKILGSEIKFSTEIDDWVFTGIIDLLLEDNEGNIIILDYKTKSSFKTKKELKEYARQLYLYSIYCKEKYGKPPSKLKFILIRKNIPIEIDYNEDDFQEALNWARDTVEAIRNCWDYSPTCDEFFCKYICDHRLSCPYSTNNDYDSR